MLAAVEEESSVPIVETHASVTVYLDGLDPEAFHRRLGIEEGEPDAAEGSDRRPPGRPHWSLRSRGRAHGDTDDHIRWLLERLELASEAFLQAVDRGAEARLWVYWLADNIGPHVWIGEDVVKRAAALRLSFHIDAYREEPSEDRSGG